MNTLLDSGFSRLDQTEKLWCVKFNRTARRRGVALLFAAVSRLGDGVFWYSLMAVLPLIYGYEALPAVGKMAAGAIVGLLIYKVMKTRIMRDRPCARHGGVHSVVSPLDQYSFPSGHTLHAVGFTTIAGYHHPELLILLLPFALLVACSRLVLGLHYPSDVLAGAVLGGAISLLVLSI